MNTRETVEHLFLPSKAGYTEGKKNPKKQKKKKSDIKEHQLAVT